MESLKKYLYYFLLYIRRPFLFAVNILIFIGFIMGAATPLMIYNLSEDTNTFGMWLVGILGILSSFGLFIAKNNYDQWILKLHPHDSTLILS